MAALGAIQSRVEAGEGKPDSPASYEAIVTENRERFLSVCDSEISRSDRYHHSFAVITFRILGMEEMIEQDRAAAFAVIDDITQGIQTRTRKTDYGTWVDGSTYAMLSLEGSKRMRFLISRVILYLAKDLAAAGIGRDAVKPSDTRPCPSSN